MTFKEILEQLKAKTKPLKVWHPTHETKVHEIKKRYKRRQKHKETYYV